MVVLTNQDGPSDFNKSKNWDKLAMADVNLINEHGYSGVTTCVPRALPISQYPQALYNTRCTVCYGKSSCLDRPSSIAISN